MLKKFLVILTVILLSGFAWAGDYGDISGSKTNVLVNDSSEYADIGEYNSFGVCFRITQADTMKSDSLVLTIQTSKDLSTWTTLYSFAKYVATDTTSKYKFYTLDSLLVNRIQRYNRLLLVSWCTNATDTSDSEIIWPTGDGTTHDWYYSTGSTYYGVIDEATLDTADFDSTAAYNKWLVVTCGDHTQNEPTVDSIRVTIRGGCQVDTGYFKFGATLADTAYAVRLLSDSTMMQAIDSATYSAVFATNPYGTSWTLPQIDSLGIILQSLTLNTGAALRAAQGYITIYYNKGDFSPALGWEGYWILKDKD